MGGKSSSAPAPDPALTAAQIKSMGYQDEMVQRIIQNADTMLPLQREQMQFGLDSARTAYSQAQDDRQFMLGRRDQLQGAQDYLSGYAQNFDTEARRDQLAATANADVQSAIDSQRGQMARGLQRRGVAPGSGAYAAMENANALGAVTAKANAANKVREAARQEGLALRSNVANMLQGYPAMGMQATGAGAGYGASGLTLANTGLAGMNSGFGQASTTAGQMGQNATSMWGAQASYKAQADQAAANSSGEMFGALLGAGAQLGAAGIFKYSDRRLKGDIVLVGKDQRTGLNLYEFVYLGGSGRRYRGVMADEVRERFPEAVFEMPDGYLSVDYHRLGIEMVAV